MCRERSQPFYAYDIAEADDINILVRHAAEAAAADGGILAAAGGDGTVRIVAHEARKLDVRIAVIPCGTFNLFARNHAIPEEPEAAIKLAFEGSAQQVRVATLNGETFVLNASLGLYAKAIRERKTHTKRFGRHRIVAILSTLYTLIKGHATMKLNISVDGQEQRVRTTMVFIGNNALQLRDLSMDVANCMRKNLLAVVTLKDMSGWKMFRFAFHGISKQLEKLNELESFCVQNLDIHSEKHKIEVALDGEMFQMRFPLKIEAAPRGLHLIKAP